MDGIGLFILCQVSEEVQVLEMTAFFPRTYVSGFPTLVCLPGPSHSWRWMVTWIIGSVGGSLTEWMLQADRPNCPQGYLWGLCFCVLLWKVSSYWIYFLSVLFLSVGLCTLNFLNLFCFIIISTISYLVRIFSLLFRLVEFVACYHLSSKLCGFALSVGFGFICTLSLLARERVGSWGPWWN